MPVSDATRQEVIRTMLLCQQAWAKAAAAVENWEQMKWLNSRWVAALDAMDEALIADANVRIAIKLAKAEAAEVKRNA